jgi:Predicted transcriptional regulators
LQAKRYLLTFVEQYEIHPIMNRATIEDAIFPDCPIRNILARISDKWSLLVIYTLDNSEKASVRFKELQRQIPDISQKMLTVTLRTLEEDGYVTRTIYPEIPPRVEYKLTERAKSLLPHINSLIGWAKENMEPIMQDRKKTTTNP